MKIFGIIVVVMIFISILTNIADDKKVASKIDLIGWKIIAMLHLILDIVKG